MEVAAFEEIEEELGIDRKKIKHDVEKLHEGGELFTPSTGEYRLA